MDKEDKIAMGLGIFLIFVIGVIVINACFIKYNSNKTCQNLGYEKYFYYNFDFCEDINGNLHYIKEYCLDMSMKEISVGDVRVLK